MKTIDRDLRSVASREQSERDENYSGLNIERARFSALVSGRPRPNSDQDLLRSLLRETERWLRRVEGRTMMRRVLIEREETILELLAKRPTKDRSAFYREARRIERELRYCPKRFEPELRRRLLEMLEKGGL